MTPFQTYGLSKVETSLFVGAIVVVAVAIGLPTRELFDDEVHTLQVIESLGAWEISKRFSTGDDHPPFFYMFFEFLSYVSTNEHFLRAAALLCTTAAFILIFDCTLRTAQVRGRQRLLLAVPFLLLPMLYGMGDAVRYYPLLALGTAVFTRSYIRHSGPTVTGAVSLGLSAGVSVFAIVPYLAFVVHRYAVRRTVEWSRDLVFHFGVALLALPGLSHTVSNLPRIRGEGNQSAAIALAKFILGFLGGYRLGLTYMWLIIAYAAFLLYLLAQNFYQLRRSGHDGPCRYFTEYSLILVTLTLLVPVVFGFDRSRSFLFVAPFIAGLAGMGLINANRTLVLSFAAGTLAVFIVFAANFHTSTVPFKRNLVATTTESVDFVLGQMRPEDRVLVGSADPVVLYRLRSQVTCVYGVSFWNTCNPKRDFDQYDVVVLITTESLDRHPPLVELQERVKRKRSLRATARFGQDLDAEWKQRLTGMPLNPWIAEVNIYR